MVPVRYAVVGAGPRGASHVRVAAGLREEGLLEELVVCDVDERRARRLATAYDLPYRTDVADLTADAATLATPTESHRELGTRLLERGVDLLVEAPLAQTATAAWELVEVATDRNRTLAAGHQFRYLPALVDLRRRIEAGELGSIEYLQTNHVSVHVPRTTAGVLRSIAVHDVDVFAYLLEPTAIDADVDRDAVVCDERERSTTLALGYGDAAGVVNVSWEAPAAGRSRHLVVAGSDGSAYVDYLEDVALEFSAARDGADDRPIEPDPGTLETEGAEPLRAALIDFLHAVETGREPHVPGRVGAEAVSTLERVRTADGSSVDAPLASGVEERA